MIPEDQSGKKDNLVFHSSPDRLLKQISTNPDSEIFFHGFDDALSADRRSFFKGFMPRKANETISKNQLEKLIKKANEKGLKFQLQWGRSPAMLLGAAEERIVREDQLSKVIPPKIWDRLSSLIQLYISDEKRTEAEKAEMHRQQLRELLSETKLNALLEEINSNDSKLLRETMDLALLVTATARKIGGSPEYQVESRFHQLTKKNPVLKRYLSALLTGVLPSPLGRLQSDSISDKLKREPLAKFPQVLRTEFQEAFQRAKQRFSKTLENAIEKIGSVIKNFETPQKIDLKLAAPIEESLRMGVPESMPEVAIQEEILDCIQLRRLTFEEETLKNIFKALCEQSVEEGDKPTGLEARIFGLFIESYWDSDRIGALYLEPSMLFSKALAQPGNPKLTARFSRLTDEQKVIYDILVKNYNQVVAQNTQRLTSAYELAELVRRKYQFQMIKEFCERRARNTATRMEREILLSHLREKEAGVEAEKAYNIIRNKLDDTISALICYYTVLPGLELPPGTSTKFLSYKDQQSREMGELWKIIHTCKIVCKIYTFTPQKVEQQCLRADVKFPSYSNLAKMKLEEHFDQYHDANITSAVLSFF